MPLFEKFFPLGHSEFVLFIHDHHADVCILSAAVNQGMRADHDTGEVSFVYGFRCAGMKLNIDWKGLEPSGNCPVMLFREQRGGGH